MSIKDQNITDVIKIIKDLIRLYQNLESNEQDMHLFYLRNALANLVSVISYTIYKIGKNIEIDVKPSDSIEKKIEKILFFYPKLFDEDQKRYLKKICKYQHKIAHNDLFFPKVNEVEKCIEEFEPNIKIPVQKSLKVKVTKKSMEQKLLEIEDFIDKTEQFVPEKVKSDYIHFRDQINIFKSLSLRTSEDLILIENKVFNIYKNLKVYFPFTRKFLDLILEEYLRLIDSPLKLFNTFIHEFGECPFCGSDFLTEDFFICEGYTSTAKIEIKSLKPLELVRTNSLAYASIEFCEISDDGLCAQCHTVYPDILFQKAPPEHSVFCEACGFYFFPDNEVGVNLDFTDGYNDELFEEILRQLS